MKALKLTTLFLMVPLFVTLAHAEDNVERALRLHKCNHDLYQKTNQALTFTMVMDFCAKENPDTLMKAANLWNEMGTIGFLEALARVKASPQQ